MLRASGLAIIGKKRLGRENAKPQTPVHASCHPSISNLPPSDVALFLLFLVARVDPGGEASSSGTTVGVLSATQADFSGDVLRVDASGAGSAVAGAGLLRASAGGRDVFEVKVRLPPRSLNASHVRGTRLHVLAIGQSSQCFLQRTLSWREEFVKRQQFLQVQWYYIWIHSPRAQHITNRFKEKDTKVA